MKRSFKLPGHWTAGRIDIDLVGAGGTGSDLAVRLAKMHRQLVALGAPGLSVTIWDFDSVSASNVGRQHFSPSAIGLQKAVVLAHSLNLAYGLDWKAKPRRYDHEDRCEEPDLLLTCVDSAVYRAELGRALKDRHSDMLWGDCGNGRDIGQCVIGHAGTPWRGERLPNVADLYPELADMQSADQDEPSCSAEEAMRRQEWPVNQTAAMLMAEMLWNLIRKGSLDYHGVSFTLNPLQTTPLWIDTDAWAFFGYTEEAQAA